MKVKTQNVQDKASPYWNDLINSGKRKKKLWGKKTLEGFALGERVKALAAIKYLNEYGSITV